MGNPTISERFLTDDEVREASAATGWQFWVGPTMAGVGVIVPLILMLLGIIERSYGLILLLLCSLPTAIFLSVRLREYGNIKHDLEIRVVKVVEGAPDVVWTNQWSGFCYARCAGLDIRVPNDMYRELQDANLVKVVFLPTSLVAVSVEVEHGIGLSASALQ
jgi:hypothetical protein